MIKAVIFDFGGVLLKTQDWSGRRAWESRLNLESNEAEAAVFNSDLGQAAQLGEISYGALLEGLGSRWGLSTTELKAFEKDFWAGDVLDQALVQLIQRLRPLVKTALISNAFPDLREVLTEQFDIASLFDVIVISAEEGIMKPDPRLYQCALDRLGLAPAETVFIDDFGHNVAGAEAIGMQAIQYTPDLDLKIALNELGITHI